MKKKVDTDALANELRNGSAFFRQARERDATVAVIDGPGDQPPSQPVMVGASQPTSRPAGQPRRQSMTLPKEPAPLI